MKRAYSNPVPATASGKLRRRPSSSQVKWAMRDLPAPPPRPEVEYKPVYFTRRQFEELTITERWGQPDGPEIRIEFPIQPLGKMTLTGRDTWGGQVPIPALSRAMRITSVAPHRGEKYRFIINWSGGSQWRVVQKASRTRSRRIASG